ncbi:MAG TPA: hypothetical protein VFY50_00575 [Candidatus Nitrosocosmicus sp.]|nr:hypothetical protein [Candidatus Nitrosocosmicus sp.]
MFKTSTEIYDRVIRLHIQGYSMGEIAKIIGGISKTAVHNIIHDWKSKTSAGSIEDIRIFLRNLRESGFTIENCIEGFRIQQQLKEFGISDEPCDWIIDGDGCNTNGSPDIGTSNHSRHNLDE